MDSLVQFLEALSILSVAGLVFITFGLVQWVLKGLWIKFDPEKQWLPLGATCLGLLLGLVWGAMNYYYGEPGKQLPPVLFQWGGIGVLVGFAAGGLYKVLKGFLPKTNLSREYWINGETDRIITPKSVTRKEFDRLVDTGRVLAEPEIVDGRAVASVTSLSAAETVLGRKL